MILGIGCDLVDIRRIEKILARQGERFIKRCFTAAECKMAKKRTTQAATFAKRFAAKEACAKALGIGIAENTSFCDIGVENLPSGQPILKLSGGALARLKKITPKGMKARLHVTISDEAPYAQAFVVIEAIAN
jgi:holo-[acyl-carrier protein] synthase